MRAIGLTSGIGSLLVGAREAGFDIVGNIEWRKYYRACDAVGRNTFIENFPGAVLHESLDHMTMDEIERFMNVELAMSHPECGAYSALSGANRNFQDRKKTDQSDIPLLVDMVARLKPRFLVMDDLPPSLVAYPMQAYAEKLSGYDLFPEWVSNWGYGNVQKGRNRMFMIGSLKSEGWAFTPSENPHNITVADILGDLPEPRRGANIPNHDPHVMNVQCLRGYNLGGYGNRPTWFEVKKYFEGVKAGHALKYIDKDGRELSRVAFHKTHWDGPSHVLTGGNATLHNLRCDPLTVRERARIQGFPDDFIFYGTILDENGEWNHDKNMTMTRQTGKAMPVHFARYVSHQVMLHCLGKKAVATNTRILRPNTYVDTAKRWYCTNVGYADQERACGNCWLYDRCDIRTAKYGIGIASVPKPPLPRPRPRPPVPEPPPPAARGLQSTRKDIDTKIVTFGG